jgi:cysteinyl-tRNA synthetase
MARRSWLNYWLHNGFLDMSGEKMSKSLGNVIIPHELLKTTPGEVIRWALLSGHYRQPLDWTPELIEQSARRWTACTAPCVAPRRARPASPSRRTRCGRPVGRPQHAAGRVGLLRAVQRHRAGGDGRRRAGDHRQQGPPAGPAGLLGFLQADPDAWFEGDADDDLKAKVEDLLARGSRPAPPRTGPPPTPSAPSWTPWAWWSWTVPPAPPGA